MEGCNCRKLLMPPWDYIFSFQQERVARNSSHDYTTEWILQRLQRCWFHMEPRPVRCIHGLTTCWPQAGCRTFSYTTSFRFCVSCFIPLKLSATLYALRICVVSALTVLSITTHALPFLSLWSHFRINRFLSMGDLFYHKEWVAPGRERFEVSIL